MKVIMEIRPWPLGFFESSVVLMVALACNGCAAQEPPHAVQADMQQQTVSDAELVDAHLDKRKFLLAASMLGRSAERDIALVSLMTGVMVSPKSDGNRSLRGVKTTFGEFIVLYYNKQVSGNTEYSYGYKNDGT